MNKRFKKMSLTVFFLIFISAPLFARGSYEFQKEFKKNYDAKPGMKMSVFSRNGKIKIEKWDKDQVKIFAVIGTNKSMEELDKIDIDISIDENIVIETRYPGYKSKKTNDYEVNYEIKVPDHLVVSKVRTSNGKIELEGTKGPSELVTTNGKIEVENVEGDIESQSTNGKIDVENVNGFVSARTTNGKIDVKSEGIKDLNTTNGKIKAEIKKIKKNIEIRTTNSQIKLYLSSALNAVLELSVTNGEIDMDDVPLEIISKHKNKHIKGKMGKGGPEISVSTTNGKIKVRKL